MDRNFKDKLTLLAIREGWIDKYTYGEYPFQEELLKRRIQQKSKILQLLTLFDKIDGGNSPYDFSKFISEGMISKDSNLIHYKNIHYGGNEHSNLSKEDKDKILNLRKHANTIIAINKLNILNSLEKEFLLRRKGNIFEVNWSYYDYIPKKSTSLKMLDYIADEGEINQMGHFIF